MPNRGEDLESLSVANAIKHLANVDVIYTERAYAGSHPNSRSLSLYRADDTGGIYEEIEIVAPDGVKEGVQPTLVLNKSDVPNYSKGARVTIVQHDKVYEAEEVDSSRGKEVSFVLRMIGDA